PSLPLNLLLRLRRALLEVFAGEQVLARWWCDLQAASTTATTTAAEREQPSLAVGRRHRDLPALGDHALAPDEEALVLLLDLLGRQAVLLGLCGLERLHDVRARCALRQAVDVVGIVRRRARVALVRRADELDAEILQALVELSRGFQQVLRRVAAALDRDRALRRGRDGRQRDARRSVGVRRRRRSSRRRGGTRRRGVLSWCDDGVVDDLEALRQLDVDLTGVEDPRVRAGRPTPACGREQCE